MTFELNQSARTVVFQRRVKSLTHEMAQALYRSSRSPLINNGDFSLGFLMPGVGCWNRTSTCR